MIDEQVTLDWESEELSEGKRREDGRAGEGGRAARGGGDGSV